MPGSTAGTRITCPECKDRFIRSRGSRRIFCEACRPPKGRGDEKVKLENLAPVLEVPSVGRIEAAHLKELEAIDRSESAAGVKALAIARMMDFGLNTGSQFAALSRELQSAMDRAKEGAATKGDSLDELTQRRAARLA